MWHDPEFDVVNSSLHLANLKENDILIPISLSRLYPNSVCYQRGDISIDDIEQGCIGDCWLLSGLAALAIKTPSSIQECIVADNPSEGWTVFLLLGQYIVVDHFVPGVLSNNKLKKVIAPKVCNNEYWPVVLEKAFIKLFASSVCPSDIKQMNIYRRFNAGLQQSGCNYIDIHGGFPRWVFAIILGIKLDPIFTKNQDWIEKFKDQDGYTTVACACTSTEHNDSVKDNGFVYGHAYTVVGVDLEKRLIRVRNPWGTYESTKYDDGVNDGEFWVDEETFIELFKVVCMFKKR